MTPASAAHCASPPPRSMMAPRAQLQRRPSGAGRRAPRPGPRHRALGPHRRGDQRRHRQRHLRHARGPGAATGVLEPAGRPGGGRWACSPSCCASPRWRAASRRRGGPYLYAREAFGPFVGFQAGWLTFWIRVTAVAAEPQRVRRLPRPAAARGGHRRRARRRHGRGHAAWSRPSTCAACAQATWTVDLFTLAKLLPLSRWSCSGLRADPAGRAGDAGGGRPDWTQAILLLMFAYGGFEAPLIPAGEARNPAARHRLRAAGRSGASSRSSTCSCSSWWSAWCPRRRSAQGARGRGARRLARAPRASPWPASPPWSRSTATARAPCSSAARAVLDGRARRAARVRWRRVHPRFRTPDVAIFVFAVGRPGAGALYGGFASATRPSPPSSRLLTYGLTCVALLAPALPPRRTRGPAFRVPGASAGGAGGGRSSACGCSARAPSAGLGAGGRHGGGGGALWAYAPCAAPA